ncbi:MAG TPA: hypothetical protein DCM54_16190 [Gammaproteobacteria bacterium]|nr:hypothetical protein [Gammaproteobacteria bacterium]
MDPISQDEISHVFDEDQVVLPDLSTVAWDHLDYLGWVHPSGHLAYLVLVSPESGKLTGSVLRRRPRISKRPRYEMCSWCHHVHRNNRTAMFTLSVKGTEGRHLIGKVLCKDLDCSLRIRNLVEPASYMDETLYVQARIWRMQKSMHRWLKRANRL